MEELVNLIESIGGFQYKIKENEHYCTVDILVACGWALDALFAKKPQHFTVHVSSWTNRLEIFTKK